MRAALVVGFATALAVAFGLGWRMGRDACEADHNQKRLEQIEAGKTLQAQRRQLALDRIAMAEELEVTRNADPVVVERCLGPGRVQRLNRLR